MTDQDLIIKVRSWCDSPNWGIPVEAVRELVDICEAEIGRGGPWDKVTMGHDGRGQDERYADRERAGLARSVLRVIAKGYGIDWRKS